jgi:hypothetical protein
MFEDIIKIINGSGDINTGDGITSLTYDGYGNLYRLSSPAISPATGIANDINDQYRYRFPFSSGTHVW